MKTDAEYLAEANAELDEYLGIALSIVQSSPAVASKCAIVSNSELNRLMKSAYSEARANMTNIFGGTTAYFTVNHDR